VTADFAGQTALVTGGTTGIGRAVAGQLAAGGAHVIISGRDPGRGQAARAAVAECGGADDFVAADLAEVDDVQRLAERALELGQGCIDVLVNNAALYPHLATADQDAGESTLLFNVNVRAPFILTKTLVPHMIRRGTGVSINLGSIAGLIGLPTTAADGLTKAALTSLRRTWAAEYGSQGVRVNHRHAGADPHLDGGRHHRELRHPDPAGAGQKTHAVRPGGRTRGGRQRRQLLSLTPRKLRLRRQHRRRRRRHRLDQITVHRTALAP
jgi:NAD(P)-dependent dehydrogenase (short-subunit alcohol dehydrogenase family)